MGFEDLVQTVTRIHGAALGAAGEVVHRLLSLRNWWIGASIVEFEQGGENRAAYGEALVGRLSDALKTTGYPGLSSRSLHNFRQVALAYPELDAARLRESVLPGSREIVQTSAESPGTLFPKLIARNGVSSPLPWRDSSWLERLFTRLTFSHLLELSRIDDPLKRAFYELHCLKEGWSVRELQRQRGSLLYERIGLSKDPESILALTHDGELPETPSVLVRDPYVLEFLDLKPLADLREATLEQALVDHLQAFLLELGRDFCFIGRQFRVTVGNVHHYLDLLFFHRSLHCLVAIDLKIGAFEPAHAGQMNFYLGYLAENVTRPDENPPVGILLCSDKDTEVVRYATVGMEDSVFVSRYLLELPSEELLARWLREERALLETANGCGG